MNRSSGIRTTEHAMAWVVLLISGWAAVRGVDTVERCMGLANVAAVWGYYTHSRTKQKRDALAADPSAPVASVVQWLVNLAQASRPSLPPTRPPGPSNPSR